MIKNILQQPAEEHTLVFGEQLNSYKKDRQVNLYHKPDIQTRGPSELQLSKPEEIVNIQQLRSKNPLVIDRLYDDSLNFCVNCGLRFCDDKYPKHLDEHYKINRGKKKKVPVDVFGKFLNLNEWIQGEKHIDSQDEKENNNENKNKELQVLYNDNEVSLFCNKNNRKSVEFVMRCLILCGIKRSMNGSLGQL